MFRERVWILSELDFVGSLSPLPVSSAFSGSISAGYFTKREAFNANTAVNAWTFGRRRGVYPYATVVCNCLRIRV